MQPIKMQIQPRQPFKLTNLRRVCSGLERRTRMRVERERRRRERGCIVLLFW
ncbi:hypothetical protein Hanom_Chr04g00287131 [Helianthus anomalus]